jgi:hypothetical protein
MILILIIETLLMEMHTTKLTVYSVGLYQTTGVFEGEQNRRIECLWNCLNALQSWIEVFRSIVPADYVGFSWLSYANMLYTFVGMYRLSTFEHPEWDRSLCQTHIDISSFLEENANKFSQVKDAAGLDAGGSDDVDTFTILAARFRNVQRSWEAMNASTMSADGIPSNEKMYPYPMDFTDDDWLRDLFPQ